MSPLGTFLRGSAPKPNAAPALRITLARRLVETPGAPFVESQEVFTDLASARDELGLLPAAQGPTVVRVRVENGTASDRVALEGDWLVDPDAGDRVARLPVPGWDYDAKANRWARERPWLEAWETCQDARWMLSAAGRAGVARSLLVLAACACARTALRFVPSGEVRPLQAIEAAEGWTRGEVPLEEVQRAAEAAWDARADAAASHADAAADRASWAAACAYADAAACAYYTASASASADAAAWTTDLARCADLVRREIPTLVVLRAVATRA